MQNILGIMVFVGSIKSLGELHPMTKYKVPGQGYPTIVHMIWFNNGLIPTSCEDEISLLKTVLSRMCKI